MQAVELQSFRFESSHLEDSMSPQPRSFENENSPLLDARGSQDGNLSEEENRLDGREHAESGLLPRGDEEAGFEERERSKSGWYLFLLTLSIGG